MIKTDCQPPRDLRMQHVCMNGPRAIIPSQPAAHVCDSSPMLPAAHSRGSERKVPLEHHRTSYGIYPASLQHTRAFSCGSCIHITQVLLYTDLHSLHDPITFATLCVSRQGLSPPKLSQRCNVLVDVHYRIIPGLAYWCLSVASPASLESPEARIQGM
jgi:hypothetical protein